MPRRVKKRRQLTTDTGADAGWEEYWDYIFPEDEVSIVYRQQLLIFLALGCQAEHESAQNGKRVEEKERLRFGLGFRLRLVYSSFLVPSFTATQFSLRNYKKNKTKSSINSLISEIGL